MANRRKTAPQIGDIYFDTHLNSYGVVLEVHLIPFNEVRLHSDGICGIDDRLYPLGHIKDTGTKKELIKCLISYKNLRASYPNMNYPPLNY